VDGGGGQINIDMALKNANAKLTQWTTKWEHEMRRANGSSFHFSFLNFFCLYSSLFLNSFGVQADVAPENRTNSHLRALSACFENALNVLRIASKDFRELSVLRYGQETTTVMTAYSAIFLLKLLRSSDASPGLQSELPEGAAREIHSTIIRTAEAYNEAAHVPPTMALASYHARFLWHLIHVHRTRPGVTKDRPHRENSSDLPVQREQASPSQATPSPPAGTRNVSSHHLNYPVNNPPDVYLPNAGGHNMYGIPARTGTLSYPPSMGPPIEEYTSADHQYYRTMLFDLGFGGEQHHVLTANDNLRNAAYGEGLTTHYTQYPYGTTQAIGQAGFVGS